MHPRLSPWLSAVLLPLIAGCVGPGPAASTHPLVEPSGRPAKPASGDPTGPAQASEASASTGTAAAVQPPQVDAPPPDSPQPGPGAGDDARASAADWARLVEGVRAGKRWAERGLREEVATGERSADAALALVEAWASPRAERYHEALAVVDAALARVPDPRLRAIRAGLLRDLGSFDDARGLLDGLSRDAPAALHAEDWMSLAELWAYADQPERVRGVFEQASGMLADDREWQRLAGARQALDQELRAGSVGTLERDVFAVLRGHEDAVERLRALQVLSGLGEGREKTILAAVALALDDPDADVRAVAIRSLPDGVGARAEVVGVALLDPDPEVRLAGAAAAGPLPKSVRVELLTQALSRESDPVVAQTLRTAIAEQGPDR